MKTGLYRFDRTSHKEMMIYRKTYKECAVYKYYIRDT